MLYWSKQDKNDMWSIETANLLVIFKCNTMFEVDATNIIWIIHKLEKLQQKNFGTSKNKLISVCSGWVDA